MVSVGSKVASASKVAIDPEVSEKIREAAKVAEDRAKGYAEEDEASRIHMKLNSLRRERARRAEENPWEGGGEEKLDEGEESEEWVSEADGDSYLSY